MKNAAVNITHYRPEIDGLRAFAVLPVILYHAGFKIFSGGYVGVDIFFVISGYLITNIILNEISNGKFKIITFWERRARRILPALFFIMLIIIPFSLLVMMPDDTKQFFESLMSISIFSSNFFFMFKSGYFETTTQLKPLIHTWSLSIEEQYYLIFPIFIMFAWKYFKGFILPVLFIVFIFSLGLSHWASLYKPHIAFYLMPTRAWELLLGVFSSYYFFYNKNFFLNNLTLTNLLSILGFFCIILSIIIYSDSTPFPGIYALLPTLGTLLIIIFCDKKTILYKFLCQRFFIGMGLISYSAYLWHQPIFAFLKYRSLSEPSLLNLILAIFLIIPLSYLTYLFIEKPFRNKKFLNTKKIFMLASVFSIFFLIIGYYGYKKEGFPKRLSSFQTILLKETTETFVNCQNKNLKNIFDNQVCIAGNNQGDIKYAIIGDSHAQMLAPPIIEIANKQKKRTIIMVKGGCPPIQGVKIARGNSKVGVCKDLADVQFKYIKENNIKTVFFISRWSLYLDKKDFDNNKSAYFIITEDNRNQSIEDTRINFIGFLNKSIKKYKELGVRVILIEQIPVQKINPVKNIININQKNINSITNKFSVKKTETSQYLLYSNTLIKQLAKLNSIESINFTNDLCNDLKCNIMKDKKFLYREESHLNKYGALSLINRFEQIMK